MEQLLQILVLAIVQGAAELLPVSSSAHVIVAEKLMGLDPTSPQMTMLLVMLHTGTMLAVIAYFGSSWRLAFLSSAAARRDAVVQIGAATACTGAVGYALLKLIEHLAGAGTAPFEVEQLFGNARLMAAALAAAGVLIIASSRMADRDGRLTAGRAMWIGAVQGLCLPFRGFSRSGATISTGLALGVARRRAEEFSFALAVVLTPAVIAREAYRLCRAQAAASAGAHLATWPIVWPSLVGMGLSFLAGLLALRWLSAWLEAGRWHFFGVYCLLASLAVLWTG